MLDEVVTPAKKGKGAYSEHRVMTDWNQESANILRAELKRRGVTYRRLAELLNGLGLDETERAIANKMARGTFSFAFFLQVLKAIDAVVVVRDLKGD